MTAPVRQTAEATRRADAQRTAERVLVAALAAIALLLAGSALGLLLAPKDDSALGVMRALVFRCH